MSVGSLLMSKNAAILIACYKPLQVKADDMDAYAH
jgi:hypothetical protein